MQLPNGGLAALYATATPPAAPAISGRPGPAAGQVTISFKPLDTVTKTVNVYQGTAAGGEKLIKSGLAAPAGAVTNFIVSGLSTGTSYYFKVAGVAADGTVGAQSAEVHVVTAGTAPVVTTGGGGGSSSGGGGSGGGTTTTTTTTTTSSGGHQLLWVAALAGAWFFLKKRRA